MLSDYQNGLRILKIQIINIINQFLINIVSLLQLVALTQYLQITNIQ